MKTKRKIYYVVDSCKELLKSFAVQGHEEVVFSALFYRNGKKLNSIDKADTHYFAQLLRGYDKTENPDKVKVEFRNTNSDTLVWAKEFNLSEATETPAAPGTFQGFGEAEINDIVQRRLSDYEKAKENEMLQAQLEEALAENEELKGQLEEATATLDAKKQLEYYANLMGMAMPGLAKVLGKTTAGQALGFLSGVEEEATQIESPKQENDSRATILQLIDDYCKTLDNATLGTLYLLFCELDKDHTLIGKTLATLQQAASNEPKGQPVGIVSNHQTATSTH